MPIKCGVWLAWNNIKSEVWLQGLRLSVIAINMFVCLDFKSEVTGLVGADV